MEYDGVEYKDEIYYLGTGRIKIYCEISLEELGVFIERMS